jgi:hypothetical protein
MAFCSLSLLACGDALVAVLETATGAMLAATAGAAFAALAADAGAPDPSAFPAASTLGGAFASGCLGPGLTAATVSVGGRLTGFGVLTVVFGAAGLAPTRFTMASVFFALRTATATPPLRFRLATAALWDGFAATFFRGSVFPLAARFFVTADDDLPVARLRADLTDDFADLIPLDFAGFLVDFLRAAIRLSTHEPVPCVTQRRSRNTYPEKQQPSPPASAGQMPTA